MATKNQVRKEPSATANRAVMDELRALGRELKAGKLDRRAQGATGGGRELLEEVNAIVETLAAPLAVAIDRVSAIGRGEIPSRLGEPWQGDLAKLQDGLNSVIEVTHMRQADIEMLLAASVEGKLETRADVAKYKDKNGAFVEAVNDMLDAILLPIGEGNRILAQISDGKIDELIAQTYKGDHEKMKLAVNNVAAVLQGLQKELMRLTDASQDGQLSERGKARAVPGRLRRHRARCQRHAGRDSAADRRRQSHSGPDLRRQDRRADRADLQGRSRKDEAGRQQRGWRAAGPAEGTERG